MESTWQVILAIAVAAVLKEVADVIRQWGNRKFQRRMETKMDGNTALTATSLVSSGRLPEAAPCIPSVAKAVSESNEACASAVEYATTATAVAHATMAKEGIPIQSQDLLVEKLHAKIVATQSQADETKNTEARHAQNNAQWVRVLNERLDAMKGEIEAMKAKPTSGVIKERLDP